jgi:hypothetical protein
MITYKDSKGIIHEEKYDKNTNEIILSHRKITQILSVKDFTNLVILWLNNNRITEIKSFDRLLNLQHLFLSGNEITEIKGLDRLISLRSLALNDNKIKEIKGLSELTSLRSLALNDNKIKEIKGLSGLTSLRYLWLSDNRMTEIKGLDGLTNLQELWLNDNKITEIKGLSGLTNLQELWLDNNKIIEVPFTIMNLRSLSVLVTNCGVHPIIERFLNRNRIKMNKTIYDDSQNVHDSDIVKSVKQSIYNIIDKGSNTLIESVLIEVIDDKVLSKSTKSQLVEYCQDKTIHSLLNLTFSEVLCSVWKIITEHKESDEIKKILNCEMKDSMCKCFTGRLSRLVNCLNGFDERVSVTISNKQEILNVIINVRNKYIDNVERQKDEVVKELIDRGFDQATINEYIVYLE